VIILFHEDVAYAAENTAGRQSLRPYGLQNRVELKSESLSAERIKLDQKQVRPFRFKKGQKPLLALFFDLVDSQIFGGAKKPFKGMIHLKVGETKLTDMFRQVGFNGGAAGDQNHLVIGQCPAYFKAAKKMADSQNMLAVLDYFHISSLSSLANVFSLQFSQTNSTDLVFFSIKLAVFQARGFTRVKLPQNGTVFR